MGVRGLMTYMQRNFHFIEPYELHGGYLVIDGCNLAFQIYRSSKCNCVFGGDYDVYANAIGKFFDDVAMCEIVPLVVLDGGLKHNKMKIHKERLLEDISTVSRCVPGMTSRFIPLAVMNVFESVLRQKGVRLARCLFDADSPIAGLAQCLNCPVLSNHSDFYIYEGTFIPRYNRGHSVSRTTNEPEYMIRCQLFKTKNLSKAFPGLDSSVLPLVAVLLGKNYVTSEVFEGFCASLKLFEENCILNNLHQRKIDTIFRWLQNQNINEAVATILSKLARKHREGVLVIIEAIINSYLSLPFDMLVPLGFSDKYANALKERRCAYKFQGNIDTPETEQLRGVVDPTALLLEFQHGNEKDARNERFAKSWPSWFAQAFAAADFPTYFFDMSCSGLFKVPIQIENFRYPSAYVASLKIVEVIYGLLVAGREKPPKLTYLMREGCELIDYEIGAPMLGTISTKFPPLAELRNTPMKIRKQIIDDALKITGMEKFFEDIPEKWKLYLAAIFYWMRQTEEPAKNFAHLSAILFAMLLGVVNDKGVQKVFKREHKKNWIKIRADRKKSENVKSDIRESSIIAALEAVTKNDCLFATRFFIRICKMDGRLVGHRERFNVDIVHAFAQFQCCLRHAIDLNALLGCPYKNSIISQMYNGTMLYNLYTKFENRTDIESDISANLRNSPSLQNLIRLLVARVKTSLDKVTIDDNIQRREETKDKGENNDEVKHDDNSAQVQ